MNSLELINKLNDDINLPKIVSEILTIFNETESQKNALERYFHTVSDQLLFFSKLLEDYDQNFISSLGMDEVINLHNKIYDPFTKNYKESFLNPTFAVKELGSIGNILSALAMNIFGLKDSAITGKKYVISNIANLFMNTYAAYKKEELSEAQAKLFYQEYSLSINLEKQIVNLKAVYSDDDKTRINFVKNNEFHNVKDLYQFLDHVTENEIKTLEFLATYPQEKIEILAESITKSYKRGFDLGRKDLSKKETVLLYYNLGQEKIIKSLIPKLEKIGLRGMINRIFTTSANKQTNYDHRFDNAIYLTNEYFEKSNSLNVEAHEVIKKDLNAFSGPVYFDKFGETPFSPISKEESLSLNQEQQQLSQKIAMESSKLRNQYMSRKETSFCIIGFPVPEIGDKFADIFEDTLEINMMDTERYEEIQQHLIDVLDEADYVQVKGKNGNLTDIKVAMHKLKDPAKHTNFVNCGADVNVPVGEVFTSPVLKGTNGLLHVRETFLNGLKYQDLKIEFKDGYVGEYSCANFDNDEDGKKYVHENLLFPHKTLPLGEFAIGTNTKAYVMAQKYDILNLLPILIVEKMGPHFAIGDTCFSWEEDWSVFNPIDGKEITARDNEHSAMRTTDVQKAYTNRHTDITLPYEDLDFIAAVKVDGTAIDIIRNGRFVVSGTEALNEPLNK